MDNIKFIADIGSNHNGSLDRCLELINEAKKIGCWGIKLQLFKGDKLYKDVPKKIVEELKKRELPIEWLPVIKRHCKALNIKFGCTPFFLESINELKYFVNFLKISSFDILRNDLIIECKKTQLPLMISLGCVVNKYEIDSIINDLLIYYSPQKPILFHCVSSYPTRYEDCNLRSIKWLRYRYENTIGWSDHTVDPMVIYQAINNGAKLIEFHLDLDDDNGWENHNGHCWNPKLMKNVIKNANRIEIIDGDCNDDIFLTNNRIKKQIRADRFTGLRNYN